MPLKQAQFPAAIGFVDTRQADIIGTAIVAGEDDQRIIVQTIIFERLHHLPDTVNSAYHGRIDPCGVIDYRPPRHNLPCGL